MKTTYSFVLVVAALLFAIPAHADGSSGDTIMQISGSFTGPVESFSESYQLDETTQTLVPGSMQFSGSGEFGALSLFQFSPKTVDWNDAAGDQVQVTFYEDLNPLPQPDSPAEFWLYSPTIRLIGDDWPGGTITISNVPAFTPAALTPEPASLALLALGLTGLVALKLKAA
jgi:hypothetical protein